MKTKSRSRKFSKFFVALVLSLLFTTLPVAFAVSVNPSSIVVEVTDTTATIGWTTDTASTGIINYGKTTSGMQSVASTAGQATAHEASITNIEDNQYYYYNIQATDSAGTYTSTYMNFTTLPKAPEDLEADVDINYVTLSWTEPDGAQYYNVYRNGALSAVAPGEEYETSALSYKTTYTFKVTAVDKYGRESAASEEISVTTKEQPVNMTFVQANEITKTTAVVSWQTDRETNATIKYGTTKTVLNLSQKDSDLTTTHEFTLKDLQEDTTYYYEIIAASSTGAEIYYFKTLGDETAIEIMNVESSDPTRSTVEISWTTNYETRGSIEYSTDDSFSESKREDTEQVQHSEQLSDLLSGMTYYYKVVVDSTESDIYNFTTSESLYDFLDLEDVPSLVSSATLTLKGATAENGKIYIFVNKESNPYAQVMMTATGTQFEANVTLNAYSYVEGVKGRNIVEIDSWDENNNKAVKTYTIDTDLGSPLLTLNDIPTYINTNKVNVSGYTEQNATVTFLIDEKSKGSIYVSDETGFFSYQVDVGTSTTNHTFAIEAQDYAANTVRYEKIIYVDRQDPKLDFYTSFAEQTHYKLFRIDGNTEPGAAITVTNYGEFSGCETPEFQTKYGECDYLANVYGPGPYQSLEALLDPTSLMVDLLSMTIGVPTSTVADTDGNFSVIVSLFPGEADQQLLGKNTLIFNVTDQAGNKYDTTKQVKYQPSCIDWALAETTSFPINIYTQDLTAGDITGSSLFELRYIGGGVPEVGKITVKEDESGGKLIAQSSVDIGTAESMYYSQSYGGLENSNEYISISSQTVKTTAYDKDTGKVYIYAPVTINRYKDNVDELPEQIGVYLDVFMSYTDGNGDLANCHMYPAVSYDIQKPESFTKWLSPTMINQTIELLDQTINVTESAVKYLEITARWTTVACGATIAWNYLRGFDGGNYVEDVSGEQCNVNLKTVYSVCDRILCPAIPPNCDDSKIKSEGLYKYKDPDTGQTKECAQDDESCKAGYNNAVVRNNNIRAELDDEYDEYKATQNPDATFEKFYGDTKKANPQTITDAENKVGGGYDFSATKPNTFTFDQDGEEITIKYYALDDKVSGGKTAEDVYGVEGCADPQGTNSLIVFTGLEKEDTPGFSIGGSTSKKGQNVWCSPKTVDQLEAPSAKNIPGCYNEECPQFDDVKCLVGKGSNMNPAEDLFGSLQCGCITGAKGHLENLLKIMYGAKKCLQQALIGETTAGYCERLMSYFVCDILTQIFKHIFNSLSQGTGVAAGLFSEDRLANFQQNSKDISSGLSNRYGNIVSNQLGLSTDDIINKACLAAFTADWSVLEDALDAIVEEVPVAPIAAAEATSRPYGYDPFTGRMSIAYNLYVGIVPGGETEIDAWLECDENYEGDEYCAQTGSDKIDLVQKGKVPGYMTKDDFFDENIMYIDENSVSWYNKMVLQLHYSVGGEEETLKIVKPITKKGDISVLDCRFSTIEGITCSVGAEFMDLANGEGGTVQLYSGSQGTQLSPKITTYYPGNQVAALVKVTNAYPDDFFFRVENSEDEFEYFAIGGTETGDYRGLQYYLLWLDEGAGSASGSGKTLQDWTGKLILRGDGEVGFMLPEIFDKMKLRIYPVTANDEKEAVTCEISTFAEPGSGDVYEKQYGIRIKGTLYAITDQTSWENVCKKDSSIEGCGDKWGTELKEKYSRLSTDGAYKCITKYDTLSSIDRNQVERIENIKFSDEILNYNPEEKEEFQITTTDAETDDGKEYVTTKYSSSASTTASGTSSKSSTINVLADINENGQGETKIYSNDQKPKDQAVKLTYTMNKAEPTGDNIKPVLHFIEPVTIIEQSTGYVNSNNKPVPIGFTAWDDKNEILTLSVGIVGYNGYQCLAKWKWDEAAGQLKDQSSTDNNNCGLTATDRSIGFEDKRPSFFEFDLTVDGSNIVIDDDAYYDITIHAVDEDQNEAEPVIRRIRFGTKLTYEYEDMLVCLGGSECSSAYQEPNMDVEAIASGSAAEAKKESEESSGSDEDEELTALT
ncbi:fibronectin type III domain-containing protein [Candidatus Woesearchaeota archaeon]|nr:fibronectin type III domain-containing protein [Candidatus Woesearchaeota archaeon]